MSSQDLPDRQFLWNIFQKADTDRSGQINASELQAALSNGTREPFNPETVRLMIGLFDRDNSGTISFDEFVALWKYVDDWRKCFLSFDKDNSYSIDKRELKLALTSFGYRLSDRFYDLIIKKFDRSKKGAVAFDDFIQACVTLERLTQSFKEYDHQLSGVMTIKYEDFLTLIFSLDI